MVSVGFEPTTAVLRGAGHAARPAGVRAGEQKRGLLGPSLDPVPNNSARCTRVRVLNVETGEIAGRACRSWRCERCSVSNRRAFRKRLHLGLAEPGTQIPKLLTLTSQPGEDPAVSRERLSRRFADVRRRLERAFPGARVEYAGTVELTRRGAVHFHVVLRGVPFLPQATWSRLVERYGFGPVVDIRRVRSEGMGRYLSKDLGGYLTKAAAHRWPAHFRRVRFSQAWAPAWVSPRPQAVPGGRPASPWRLLRVSPYHLDDEQHGERVKGDRQIGSVAADP